MLKLYRGRNVSVTWPYINGTFANRDDFSINSQHSPWRCMQHVHPNVGTFNYTVQKPNIQLPYDCPCSSNPGKNILLVLHMQINKTESTEASRNRVTGDRGSRAVYGVGLQSLDCSDSGFEYCWGHEWSSLVGRFRKNSKKRPLPSSHLSAWINLAPL